MKYADTRFLIKTAALLWKEIRSTYEQARNSLTSGEAA